MPIHGGVIYLCAVIGVYSRAVLAWELANTLDAGFCVRASVPAFGTKDAAGGPEHFSCEERLPGCGKSAPTPSGAATSRRWPHPSGSPFPASRVSD